MLSQLIYASQAVHPMNEDELADLLIAARRHNAHAGLSGMLLYANGSFLQILEGEREALDSLYARIVGDSRHTRLRLLSRAPIDHRKFTQWSMGFEALSDTCLTQVLPGFVPATPYPLVNPDLIRNGTVAEVLLDLYQRNSDAPGAPAGAAVPVSIDAA